MRTLIALLALSQAYGYFPQGVGTPYIDGANPGQGVTITGHRYQGDLAASVTVSTAGWRDGGYLFQVNYPDCAGTSAFGVSDRFITFGQAAVPGCMSASDGLTGSILDSSSLSGHVSLWRYPGYYLVIGGSLGAREDMLMPGNVQPPYVSGGNVMLQPDGGTYYAYSGMHGDVNITSMFPRTRGFIAEFYNGISGYGARTDHRAFIDWNGAYSQNHWLTKAQFPPVVTSSQPTSLGSGFDGALESTLMFDFEGRHWFFAKNGQWVQLVEKSELDALTARVQALEARCP